MVLRNILGVHNKTSNLALRSELGVHPICLKMYNLVVRYYLRLNDNAKVTNEILLAAKHEDKRLSMVSKNGTIHSTIKYLSELLGYNVTSINKGQFLNNIKSMYEKRILDELNRIKISNTGKLTFYSTLLERFQLQKYLAFPINLKERRLLTKIRISTHNLEIERGRYSRPIISREDRFCKYCKNAIEDEKHFVAPPDPQGP